MVTTPISLILEPGNSTVTSPASLTHSPRLNLPPEVSTSHSFPGYKSRWPCCSLGLGVGGPSEQAWLGPA